jgi:hypothetical protein
MKYPIDTDWVVEYLKGRPPAVDTLAALRLSRVKSQPLSPPALEGRVGESKSSGYGRILEPRPKVSTTTSFFMSRTELR